MVILRVQLKYDIEVEDSSNASQRLQTSGMVMLLLVVISLVIRFQEVPISDIESVHAR